MKLWSTDNAKYTLSPYSKNFYIPSDLSMVSMPAEPQSLVVAMNSSSVVVWHQYDYKSKVPKASVFINIFFTQSYATPKVHALTKFAAAVVERNLAGEIYAASMAGLTFSLEAVHHGFTIKLSGYR